MTWFYADGGRQMGPVEEFALDDLVRQGVVRDDTLVWREGMASWQAHGMVRPDRAHMDELERENLASLRELGSGERIPVEA